MRLFFLRIDANIMENSSRFLKKKSEKKELLKDSKSVRTRE